MEQILLSLDENLVKEAKVVFNYFGIDVQTGIKMFLTRVVNDKTISFLFSQVKQAPTEFKRTDNNVSEDAPTPNNDFKMTKNGAIRLFLNNGNKIAETVTFASKNRSAYNYWANPNIDVLKNDWSLILNDVARRKLYLFNIPAKTISEYAVTLRADNQELIDLQIMYNDSTFTDNRSRISFIKFKADEIDY